MSRWFEENPNLHALLIFLGFVAAAALAELLIRRVVLDIVRGTETDLDDEIVKRFRGPLILSLGCVGLHYGVAVSTFSWIGADLIDIVLITFAIALWVDAAVKIVAAFAGQTRTDLDDVIVQRVRRPLASTVVFVGAHYVIEALSFTVVLTKVLDSILVILGIVLWTDAALKIAKTVAARTTTTVDDEIIERLRRPLSASVIFVGVHVIVANLDLGETVNYVVDGVLVTCVMALWSQAGVKIGKAILSFFGSDSSKYQLIQPATMPLFDIVLQTIVYGGAAYGVLLAWHIDVTAWLASAGIVGIAVGFAARDTLANLFAGIFIIADRPYKVGDFINLSSGERGEVTNIGIRSTRIRTRDDIEITVPNSSLGNSKIVNESGGRHEKERVRVSIGVAYGSDIAEVNRVLMKAADDSKYILDDPKPRVRFRSFGDSALNFQLMGWIEEPVLRGRALDELNTNVYNGLNDAGIVIPFPQRDVWVRTPDAQAPIAEGRNDDE